MQINSTAAHSSYRPQKPVSFTGTAPAKQSFLSYIGKKTVDFCDFTQSGSLSRFAFVALATVLLLGARYYQARNDDERREVATRDFSAVIAAVYAIPLFKKFAGKAINSKGIPIAYGEKESSFLNKINPEKGVKIASYEQLKEWYSVKDTKAFDKMRFDENHRGFVGFCKNIAENLHGNLAKCFEIAGYDKFAKKKFTNEKILKTIDRIDTCIEKAKNEKVKQKLTDYRENLKGLFVQDTEGLNPLLKKANHAKSWVEAGCILATAALLGWALPGFNIWYTRKLYKEGNKNNAGHKPENIAMPTSPLQFSPANSTHGNMSDKFKQFHATGKLVY